LGWEVTAMIFFYAGLMAIGAAAWGYAIWGIAHMD
jgi:hypothetical protein